MPDVIPISLRAECLPSLPSALQFSSPPPHHPLTGNSPLSPGAASLVCCRSHGHFCPVCVPLPQLSQPWTPSRQPQGCSWHTHTSIVHPAPRFPDSQHPMQDHAPAKPCAGSPGCWAACKALREGVSSQAPGGSQVKMGNWVAALGGSCPHTSFLSP